MRQAEHPIQGKEKIKRPAERVGCGGVVFQEGSCTGKDPGGGGSQKEGPEGYMRGTNH